MFDRAIQPVVISGNGSRPSLFGSSIRQASGFHPTLAGARLGQNPAEWHRRARAAVAKFNELLDRTARIASPQARAAIMAWVGVASTEGTPAYRYTSVRSDLDDVQAVSPPRVSDYAVERRTNRIERLEAFNREFETRVANAETAHGRQSTPAPIDRSAATTPGAAATDWTVPLVVLGAAAVVTAGVLLLSGGR